MRGKGLSQSDCYFARRSCRHGHLDYRSQHVHVRRNGRARTALFDDAVAGVLGEVRECGGPPRANGLWVTLFLEPCDAGSSLMRATNATAFGHRTQHIGVRRATGILRERRPAISIDQQDSYGRYSSPVQTRGVRTGNRRPSQAKAANSLSPDSAPAKPEAWSPDLPSRSVQLRSGTEEMAEDSPISY